MLGLIDLPLGMVDDLRTVNVILGLLGVLVLVAFLGVPRWNEWNVPTRLGWMALLLCVATGAYGTYEVKYMTTELRVPMVTISLAWAIIASLWPRDRTEFWVRKR
jgi:hypothetical protein